LQSHPSLHTVAKQTEIRTQFSQLVTCMHATTSKVCCDRASGAAHMIKVSRHRSHCLLSP
jgi:hypothetical protein